MSAGKIFNLGFEKCSGSRKSKIRLTEMTVANAFSEKLGTIVSEKSASSLCFFTYQKPSLSLLKPKSELGDGRIV